MHRISRCSQPVIDDHRIKSLLFADDVVLSTSKSGAMVHSQKNMVSLLWVGEEILPQEFKYLRVLCTLEIG